MVATTKFLKPNEVTVCKRLAVSDSADNKRATALLAIHTGETQVSAAAISGLTSGQVRYIVRRFRVMRLEALSYRDLEQSQTEPFLIEEETTKKAKKDKKPKKEKVKDKKPKAKNKKSKKKDKKAKDKKNKDKKKSKTKTHK